MHIDKIVISGFRSFKDCEISGLSPAQNVVVGLNGSGKSNIVCALEFVLTRHYSRLDRNQRQLLICQRRSSSERTKTLSASVLVELVGCEHRLPLGEQRVAIRRTISASTDQYSVNNRFATHEEVSALLESGGISLNNSYYLVKQGIISEISMSSPRYLLDVLRSVSGAESFDCKKKKSMKLISESVETISKMEENIHIVKEQIALLNIDSQKINTFEHLVKTRRYLMQQSDQFERERAEKHFKSLETQRGDWLVSLEQSRAHLNRLDQVLAERKRALLSANQQIEELKAKLISTIGTMEDLSKDLQELNECGGSGQIATAHSHFSADQCDLIEGQLEENRQSLASLTSQLAQLEEDESRLRERLHCLEQEEENNYRLLCLLAKSPSDEERRQVITDRLQQLERDIEVQQRIVKGYREEFSELKSHRVTLHNQIKNGNTEEKEQMRQVESKKTQLDQLVVQIKASSMRKRETVSQLSVLQCQLINLESELKESSAFLDLISNDMAIAGRQSIELILKDFRVQLECGDLSPSDRVKCQSVIEGYFGQLADCIELTKPVNQALEALVRNRLFNHIVASEEVAIVLLGEVSKRNLSGTFHFVPLNRFLSKDFSIGLQESESEEWQCQPLVNCLEIEPARRAQLEWAIQSQCAGMFIVRSFPAGVALFDSSRNCDFCTLDGKMIDRAGVIRHVPSGRPTKYQLYRNWKSLHAKAELVRADIDRLSEELDLLAKQCGLLQNEKALIECHLKEYCLRGCLQSGQSGERSLQQMKRIHQLEQQISSIRQLVCRVECQLSGLVEESHFWQSQLECPLPVPPDSTSQLSLLINTAKSEFNQLLKERSLKEIEIYQLKDAAAQLTERKKQIKQSLLNETLLNKEINNSKQLLAEIESKLGHNEKEHDGLNHKLNRLNRDQHRLQASVNQMESERQQAHAEVERLSKVVQTATAQVEQAKSHLARVRLSLEERGSFGNEFTKAIDKKYRDLTEPNQVNRHLQDINQKMKKLSDSNLNEETLRRYQEMVERIENLVELKRKQQDNMNEIKKFIEIIEMQKNEIVMRTYKQVNVYLQQIFKQFVPEGSICIQFINSNPPGNDVPSGNSSNSLNASLSSVGSESTDLAARFRALRVDQFEGIEILVSFTSKTAHTDLVSLSGGQKALVSLAFIFALQQVDPTPFYVFDEVDQNLDDSYRTCVAEIIHKQVQQSKKQFILTTFRRQFLQYATKFFGVQIHNGLSHVEEIDKKKAIDFVTQVTTFANQTDQGEEDAGVSLPHSEETYLAD